MTTMDVSVLYAVCCIGRDLCETFIFSQLSTTYCTVLHHRCIDTGYHVIIWLYKTIIYTIYRLQYTNETTSTRNGSVPMNDVGHLSFTEFFFNIMSERISHLRSFYDQCILRWTPQAGMFHETGHSISWIEKIVTEGGFCGTLRHVILPHIATPRREQSWEKALLDKLRK